jgi:hypothetical protein
MERINNFQTVNTSPIPAVLPTFWTYLQQLQLHINHPCPWIVIGDFNETLFPGDQKGGKFSLSRV